MNLLKKLFLPFLAVFFFALIFSSRAAFAIPQECDNNGDNCSPGYHCVNLQCVANQSSTSNTTTTGGTCGSSAGESCSEKGFEAECSGNYKIVNKSGCGSLGFCCARINNQTTTGGTCSSSGTITQNSSPHSFGSKQMTYQLKFVGECGTSTAYHLAADVPSGWTAKFNFDTYYSSKNSPVYPSLTVNAPSESSTGDIKIHLKNLNNILLSLKYPPESNDNSGNNGGCKRALGIDISKDQSGKVGDSKPYKVTITDNDKNGCASDDLTVNTTLNSHLDGSLNQTFSMKPGDPPKIFDLSVTAKSGTGPKKISVCVSGHGSKHGEACAKSTFTITGGGGNNGGSNNPPPGGGGDGNGGGNGNTKVDVTLGLDGYGTTPRIPIGGNDNPANPINLTFKLYKTTGNALAFTNAQTVNYQSSDKKFHTTLNITDPNWVNGDYNLYASGVPYITARIPGSITVNKGGTATANNNFNMITGNINDTNESENKVDILDYNILNSCWIYSSDTSACEQDSNYITNSDLNGDGKVDQADYTLLLKEINNQGETLPN